MAGLKAQLALVRTTIAALVPASHAGRNAATFREMAGLLDAEHEIPVGDRYFEVRAIDSAPRPTSEMAPDSAQFIGGFEVVIRYDAARDFPGLSDRMAEDAEQIILALEDGTARAANVELVLSQPSGADVRDGDFVLRTLPFTAQYRRAI